MSGDDATPRKHVNGEEKRGVLAAHFATLLDKLEQGNGNDNEVSLAHDSGWTLRVVRSGMVYFENVNAGAPWEAGPLDRTEIIGLMTALSEGRLEEVSPRFSRQGYPPRRPKVEVDAELAGFHPSRSPKPGHDDHRARSWRSVGAKRRCPVWVWVT